jgi:hypothetical protein
MPPPNEDHFESDLSALLHRQVGGRPRRRARPLEKLDQRARVLRLFKRLFRRDMEQQSLSLREAAHRAGIAISSFHYALDPERITESAMVQSGTSGTPRCSSCDKYPGFGLARCGYSTGSSPRARGGAAYVARPRGPLVAPRSPASSAGQPTRGFGVPEALLGACAASAAVRILLFVARRGGGTAFRARSAPALPRLEHPSHSVPYRGEAAAV